MTGGAAMNIEDKRAGDSMTARADRREEDRIRNEEGQKNI